MLKLTRKLEYALIALRHMQDKRDTFISAKEMADMYLKQISKYQLLGKITG